jgi:hypothetical protein
MLFGGHHKNDCIAVLNGHKHIDFQKLNFQKCKKSPFEVMLISAKKKPPKEYT